MRSTTGIRFEARCRPCCGGNGDGGRGVGGDGGGDLGGDGDGVGDSCLTESSTSSTSGDTVSVSDPEDTFFFLERFLERLLCFFFFLFLFTFFRRFLFS